MQTVTKIGFAVSFPTFRNKAQYYVAAATCMVQYRRPKLTS